MAKERRKLGEEGGVVGLGLGLRDSFHIQFFQKIFARKYRPGGLV